MWSFLSPAFSMTPTYNANLEWLPTFHLYLNLALDFIPTGFTSTANATSSDSDITTTITNDSNYASALRKANERMPLSDIYVKA